jgi:hypothetical protein
MKYIQVVIYHLEFQIKKKSLLSYMKCKLPNFMLSLRKISQHINKSTCKWIQLPPLNVDSDEKVNKYFKLSKDEIKLIQNITKYNKI